MRLVCAVLVAAVFLGPSLPCATAAPHQDQDNAREQAHAVHTNHTSGANQTSEELSGSAMRAAMTFAQHVMAKWSKDAPTPQHANHEAHNRHAHPHHHHHAHTVGLNALTPHIAADALLLEGGVDDGNNDDGNDERDERDAPVHSTLKRLNSTREWVRSLEQLVADGTDVHRRLSSAAATSQSMLGVPPAGVDDAPSFVTVTMRARAQATTQTRNSLAEVEAALGGEVAATHEKLVGALEQLGSLVEGRRLALDTAVAAGSKLTEGDCRWWTKVLSDVHDKAHAMVYARMRVSPDWSEKEQVHEWLHSVDQSSVWRNKRMWKKAFEDYKAAEASGDPTLTFITRAAVDEFGNRARSPEWNTEFESAFGHIAPALYVHGFPMLSEWEESTAKKGLEGPIAQEQSLLGKVLNGDAQQIGGQVESGLTAAQSIMGQIAPMPNPADATAALKEWVRPKYTNFEVEDGDVCPRITGDGEMMTLRSGAYSGDSVMNSDAGRKQLCWMCQSTISLVQEMAVTPFGEEWDTQTDNLNHALTTVCDRISEVNASPHWQSDCKNFIEWWGPEILCRLENAGSKISLPAPGQNGLPAAQHELFDLERSFTPLSSELCEKLKMKANVYDVSLGRLEGQIEFFCG